MNNRHTEEQEASRLAALYLTGKELSERDRATIFSWMDVPEKKALLEAAVDAYILSHPELDRPDGQNLDSAAVAKGWRDIAGRLRLDPGPERLNVVRPVREAVRKRLSPGRIALRAAAVLLPAALILGGALWYERTQQTDSVEPAAFVASHSVTVPADSLRLIVLADGTEVMLNGGSILSYNDAREAELSGEAWFNVTKDPTHPFVIHSEHLTVTVLGTEFNFSTRSEAGSLKLSLYEGRVQLDHPAGSDLLEQGGREFTFDPVTGQAEVRDFDPARRPEWMFRDRPAEILSLNEIFDRIEAAYGVAIVGREHVDTGRRFNFALDENSSVDTVMEVLAFASHAFDYTIQGDTILLNRKE
jgi:ferric-dicitrate binding protein FerR (iron transport regulator)